MNNVQRYSEIQNLNLRSRARNLALDYLSTIEGIFNSLRYFERNRVHFLILHHVFQDEAAGFGKLLEFLSKTHEFVSYSEGVSRVLTGNIDKPYIAISFDDGFKNNLKAGEILNHHGISACFFLNPNTIGLQDDPAMAAFCRSKLNIPTVEFLDWADVETLQTNGHEIGSHTMGHERLSLLKDEEIRKNMDELNEKAKSDFK